MLDLTWPFDICDLVSEFFNMQNYSNLQDLNDYSKLKTVTLSQSDSMFIEYKIIMQTSKAAKFFRVIP